MSVPTPTSKNEPINVNIAVCGDPPFCETITTTLGSKGNTLTLKTKRLGGQKEVNVNIEDINKFRETTHKNFPSNIKVAVLVFDSTDQTSYQNVVQWYANIQNNLEPDTPIFLVNDISNIIGKNNPLVSSREAQQLAKQLSDTHNISYVEVDTEDKNSVQNLFNVVVKNPIENMSPTRQEILEYRQNAQIWINKLRSVASSIHDNDQVKKKFTELADAASALINNRNLYLPPDQTLLNRFSNALIAVNELDKIQTAELDLKNIILHFFDFIKYFTTDKQQTTKKPWYKYKTVEAKALSEEELPSILKMK